MSARSERLLRDLAQLFVKYPLSDWLPILDELRLGTNESRTKLADAIESQAHIAEQAKVKRKPKLRRKAKQTRALFQAAPGGDVFQSLQASLNNREILRTAQDLKAAAQAIGMKDQLSGDRREAVRIIVEYLQNQPPERLEKSLQILTRGIGRTSSDLSTEFDRWVAVIMRPREGS